MQYNQEVYECQQQFYESLNELIDRSNDHIKYWLEIMKELDPDESYRFEELDFKLDIREKIEEIKESTNSLIEVRERRARWFEIFETIMSTSLSSDDVCLRYKLTPTELLQHEKDGLKSKEEHGKKVFHLMDCMDYFDESYEF